MFEDILKITAWIFMCAVCIILLFFAYNFLYKPKGPCGYYINVNTKTYVPIYRIYQYWINSPDPLVCVATNFDDAFNKYKALWKEDFPKINQELCKEIFDYKKIEATFNNSKMTKKLKKEILKTIKRGEK